MNPPELRGSRMRDATFKVPGKAVSHVYAVGKLREA